MGPSLALVLSAALPLRHLVFLGLVPGRSCLPLGSRCAQPALACRTSRGLPSITPKGRLAPLEVVFSSFRPFVLSSFLSFLSFLSFRFCHVSFLVYRSFRFATSRFLSIDLSVLPRLVSCLSISLLFLEPPCPEAQRWPGPGSTQQSRDCLPRRSPASAQLSIHWERRHYPGTTGTTTNTLQQRAKDQKRGTGQKEGKPRQKRKKRAVTVV